MKQQFYSLPLALDQVMLKKELPKCSLKLSIDQQLHLILTTCFGGFPAKEEFGCSIWDNDFDNISRGHTMKEFIRASVLRSIQDHEKRLVNARVELIVGQQETPGTTGTLVKKRMDICITGFLNLTNEKFIYKDSFFIGPLSY